MKNQDMPANPQSFSMIEGECGTILTHYSGEEVQQNMGETKFEKAFWQVYSSMIKNCHPDTENKHEFFHVAMKANEAVNAGFKALENRND